ncbi:MFS transporter [Rodentibacter trehalosifermentans]|uniref:MFS transporter n=1 Tax=Rodentibacter trehalosifermentans TaxID=1908263 RepID=A0A1V3INH6_9PAST|nr:MFS transporter [Rodentibacter trehalosifermentans]OOF43340.1 MFS transporter [Rodentibacter trehalosifermentans]
MNIQNAILCRRFFSGVAYTAMQSVFFIYLQNNKGFDTSQIATAFSLLVFASQAFSLFAGVWGDRFGRSKMMLLGCLMDAVAYVLLLTTDYYPFLLLATFFFGLGSTLFGTNARALLLSTAADNYQDKAKAQGRFLRIQSLASMSAPLLALPFLHFQLPEMLIGLSCAIEVSMLLFMLVAVKETPCKVRSTPFRFQNIKQVLSKRFVFAHLLLFIPLAMSTSFYIIFPYIFSNLLDNPESIPVAFFINNLIAVLFQARFTRKLDFGVVKLTYIAPLLVITLIVPWFYVIDFLSFMTAYLYLVIFAFVSLFANTAMANMLVKLDKGVNQGLMFGTSKLILAGTTTLVMNIIPIVFLIW